MKQNVLFIIESLGGGGAEKVLTTLLKHIDKKLYNVTLCTIVDTGKYVKEVKQYVNYISVIKTPFSSSIYSKIQYLLKYKLVYKFLPLSLVYKLFIPKNNDIEIAFCEGFVTKLISASSNKKAKKIAWVHTDLMYNPWPRKIGLFKNVNKEIVAYGKFNKIVTVSETVEKSFKEIYGLDEKIVTIYNPIDVLDIKMKANDKIVNYNTDICNLISVGRLVPQKGYDILLTVMSALKSEGYKFYLRILGEGEQYNNLAKFIAQNDLKDCVELIGFKDNPYPYIAKSDLFICSSRSEGYSLVIAESLVLEVPVLSTYCSGPNELLDEGKYGMLVNNDVDGRGLYNGLKSILENKDLLEIYHQKAIQRNVFFSLTKIMSEINNILN